MKLPYYNNNHAQNFIPYAQTVHCIVEIKSKILNLNFMRTLYKFKDIVSVNHCSRELQLLLLHVKLKNNDKNKAITNMLLAKISKFKVFLSVYIT